MHELAFGIVISFKFPDDITNIPSQVSLWHRHFYNTPPPRRAPALWAGISDAQRNHQNKLISHSAQLMLLVSGGDLLDELEVHWQA